MASISRLSARPVGRPSHSPKVFYESFSYQAQSWEHPPHVVAKGSGKTGRFRLDQVARLHTIAT